MHMHSPPVPDQRAHGGCNGAPPASSPHHDIGSAPPEPRASFTFWRADDADPGRPWECRPGVRGPCMRRLLLDWRALSGRRMGVVSTATSVPNRAESWQRLPARPCAAPRPQHPTRSGKDGRDADDDNLAPRRSLTNINANVLHGGHVLAAHGHSQHRSHVSLWSERPTKICAVVELDVGRGQL